MIPSRLQRLYQTLCLEVVRSDLAHGLRNHLGTIRNGSFYVRQKLKLLQIVGDDPRLLELLDLIDRQVTQASALLDPPERHSNGAGPVDLAACLGRLHEELGLDQAPRLEEDTQALVSAREEEVSLAMACLLDNALEAAGPGREVQVHLESDAEQVRLVVENHGALALDPREAMQPGRTSRDGRSGLGLSIAQGIAVRWGGDVTLERPAAERTRALLSLPALSPQAR